MDKVIVKRSGWLRGAYDSMLLRPTDQKMCCLGFVCVAGGIPPDEIACNATPQQINRSLLDDLKIGGMVARLVYKRGASYPWLDTTFASDAIEINDKQAITDADREAQLIKLFGDNGIELTFED